MRPWLVALLCALAWGAQARLVEEVLGEFHQFLPDGEDGHALFTRNPAAWRPFFRQHGFALPDTP